jgi:UDP-N-acetylmuramoylalanine--D-glutamate ligase
MMAINFSGQRILILGAGVTGIAAAKSLAKRGALISLADDQVNEVVNFSVSTVEKCDISDFDSLLISPGWRPDHPLIQAAQKAKKNILNEVDLAWSLRADLVPNQRWIALTGTNGKTTTVELVATMLRAEGIKAIACGNVGTTVIEAVESSDKYDVLVLELSSFQLHWLKEASFVAAAILNIAQDHLDWHDGFENYAKTKMSIFDRAGTGIFNGDDREVLTRAKFWQGRKVFFSLDTPAPGEIGLVEDLLIDRAFVIDPQEAQMLAEVLDVTPTVAHNVSNALAAAALARAIGVDYTSIRRAIKEFKVGSHRRETIAISDGISWVDDSKATNPHAAAASLLATISAIWLAGGLAKGAQMDDLIARTKTRIKAAILFGSDRELIATALRQQAPSIEIVLVDAPDNYRKGGLDNSLMEAVVRAAQSRAVAGDTVLLAPACASMDQFNSYSDRGDRFAAAVKQLIA